MEKRKIVITGGLGYIGSELCKIYSGESWNSKITVIDNRFISERVNQLRNWGINFIQGDILDSELIKKHLPKTYIHFAQIGEDPDKRDYVVSNDKIESLGWIAKSSLDDGIKELIKGYQIISTNIFANI